MYLRDIVCGLNPHKVQQSESQGRSALCVMVCAGTGSLGCGSGNLPFVFNESFDDLVKW